MTPEEKAKMYKAIGYEENAKPGDVPESYVAMKMNFKLIALEIGLYQELREVDLKQGSSFDYFNLPSIILLKFSMATASITQRPAAEAISLTAGMKELKMTGLTRENRTPMLVQSITTDEFNLLDIFFETNPLDKECNQRVKVVARPLQIIYDAETILNLISIFQPPTNVNLSRFEETAASRLVGIKERSATGMQYVIDQKSVLDADILLMPNIIVVPHGGLYVAEEKSLVVLSLGQVHVTTKPHHRTDQIKVMHTQGQERDEILKSVMENAYDKFVVEVNDVQILVVRPEEQWQRVLNMAVSTELHVLQPTSLQITAALCVFDNDPRMPKVKIDIELPAVQLNFTEDRMLEAIDVATSIPMPQNKTIKAAPILSRSHSSISNFLNREIKKRPAAPPPSNTLIQEEIIQYTNVELNFSLKEISLTLFQSNAMCETSSGTTSTAFATPEQENISSRDTFDTSLDEITTDMLVRRFSRPSEHILSMKVLQVEAYMAQRTYETVASAK